MIADVRKLAHLPAADRRVLLRAASWLVLTRVALWTRPFARVQELVDTWSTRSRDAALAPARAAWAVQTAARIIPGATCLTQALAAEIMLRRAGERPVLRFGVARGRTTDDDFEAHAWLELRGRVLVGDHELDRYSRLDHG